MKSIFFHHSHVLCCSKSTPHKSNRQVPFINKIYQILRLLRKADKQHLRHLRTWRSSVPEAGLGHIASYPQRAGNILICQVNKRGKRVDAAMLLCVEALQRLIGVHPQGGQPTPSGESPQAEHKQRQNHDWNGIFHRQTSLADTRQSASDSAAARLIASHLLLTIMVEVAPS